LKLENILAEIENWNIKNHIKEIITPLLTEMTDSNKEMISRDPDEKLKELLTNI
jgi:hypothetical protein